MRAAVPTEHAETAAVVQWWAIAARTFKLPVNALMHLPNEGKRSVRMAAMLKSEGMRPGAPDLFLAVPKGILSGCFIEMKRSKGGTVSDKQRIMLRMLEGLGYGAHVCYGAADAIETIKEYLRG